MKLARLVLAVLAVTITAACSADVTGPTSGQPNFDGAGTYGSPGACATCP